MSLANDRIGDSDIGPLWAKHFSMIGNEVASKIIVLSLVYIIEDKAKASAANGDWLARVSHLLRQQGIPPDQFWEIQSAVST